jgi:tripartite-type tricarboxylate transporter receptor subunit TctC
VEEPQVSADGRLYLYPSGMPVREEPMKTTTKSIAHALLGALTLICPTAANAQTYPDKPIRLIVSIAAGSVTDVIMRAVANELQPRMKQPLVIENQGGAAGILGGQACARAAPDGYNICVIYHSTMSYNPLLFTKLPYNPDTDFTPIARLFFLTEGLFVSSALNVNTVAELKARALSDSKLNYATLGEGSFPDLFLQWMNNQWGTKIVGVPYRGGGPAAQALAANDVQVTRFGVGNFTALMEAGRVKALAVGLPARSPLLPNVPTLDEAGLKGFPGRGWWGLAAPRGTPPAVLARLNREFVTLFSEPKFKEFLDKQAVVSAPTTPEEFAAFLREDRKAAETLIRIANTKPEEYKPGP